MGLATRFYLWSQHNTTVDLSPTSVRSSEEARGRQDRCTQVQRMAGLPKRSIELDGRPGGLQRELAVVTMVDAVAGGVELETENGSSVAVGEDRFGVQSSQDKPLVRSASGTQRFPGSAPSMIAVARGAGNVLGSFAGFDFDAVEDYFHVTGNRAGNFGYSPEEVHLSHQQRNKLDM
ncbi:hypothetical protein ACHAPU_000869 [Fusarium lateritium]